MPSTSSSARSKSSPRSTASFSMAWDVHLHVRAQQDLARAGQQPGGEHVVRRVEVQDPAQLAGGQGHGHRVLQVHVRGQVVPLDLAHEGRGHARGDDELEDLERAQPVDGLPRREHGPVGPEKGGVDDLEQVGGQGRDRIR